MKKLIAGMVAAITIALASTGHAQDNQPHGYMIANYTIKDPATFQKYMEAAGPLAPKYNGKVIVFNLNSAAMEGHPQSVMAIAEFPSLADAQRFYSSPNIRKPRSSASQLPKARS